ncbi:hypothetical protein TNCV_4831311 [Trichonephila clavipes]|nr:hypothetical protein TNCV_4831311 [Trichonephila clavipes]
MSAVPRLNASSFYYFGKQTLNDDFRRKWCSRNLHFSAIYYKTAWRMSGIPERQDRRINDTRSPSNRCPTCRVVSPDLIVGGMERLLWEEEEGAGVDGQRDRVLEVHVIQPEVRRLQHKKQ